MSSPSPSENNNSHHHHHHHHPGYTMGHTTTTTASHAARTIHSDAAFLLPHLRPHHRILDVGCGPGTITAGLLALVPAGSVTGVDLAGTPVLAQAAAHAAALVAASPDVPRGAVAFREGDVLAGLPFPDGAFDVVFASQVLIHLGEEEEGGGAVRALEEMRRVVRAGGLVATRDAAGMLFHPGHDLERLWGGNLLRGIGLRGWPGPKMRRYYRRAGFDVDGVGEDGRKRVVVGVGSNVYGGSKDERKAHVRTFTRRFDPGQPFRESWIKVGISEDEINDCIQACEKWADTEDAWATTVQSEILAWK